MEMELSATPTHPLLCKQWVCGRRLLAATQRAVVYIALGVWTGGPCSGGPPIEATYKRMTVETVSPVKRPLHIPISSQDEQYDCQMQLGTIGMRIRQSVDQGYQVPQQNGLAQPQGASQRACVQDNSQITIPEYKRVPLPASRAAPMLVNQRTVSSSSSSLEMWEDSLDQRLSMIDDDMLRNKLGAGDLDAMFHGGANKRNWEQVDF
ncbi:hypothetical protein HG536_0C05770 [Torulaspora globosa]|uniref:Damage-regulated import facilitator 1 n=1 Tax=Torulaspora globosa TaxID=48254 RepID=A0A7G3ZFX2_9SACH|nr:uncharacterized protein HG536_0C05770 [Torulaspora globosa]QLL32408.1 hypothetical protein HG536_0C05770 [Torulaspora globosa]